MLMVIHCNNCGKDGAMPATLEYEYRESVCGVCHHRDAKTYKYFFCGLSCLAQFVNKYPYALPCQSCSATGHAYTFAENGPCRECGGTGVVPNPEAARGSAQ